jgi:hypothetical protein
MADLDENAMPTGSKTPVEVEVQQEIGDNEEAEAVKETAGKIMADLEDNVMPAEPEALVEGGVEQEIRGEEEILATLEHNSDDMPVAGLNDTPAVQVTSPRLDALSPKACIRQNLKCQAQF